VKALGRIIGLAIVVSFGAIALVTTRPGTAEANALGCGNGTHGSKGYAYAGHQARDIAHGVRATITPINRPQVRAGHVAGWVGVGGPGQGPNGETEWIQIGVASMPNTPTMVYAEITAPSKDPAFVPLVQDVQVGESHSVAVLEMFGKRDWWRVWLDGKPVTDPIFLPGSHRRWQPIVTAESYDNGESVCNTFGFRFDRVGIAKSLGGSWRAFVPGYDFLDRGYAVRQLRPLPSGQSRTLQSDSIQAYAFDAVAS
jgi:hypothetical protein